jgi:glycosyltransferase involved in cell wall biosynthesis
LREISVAYDREIFLLQKFGGVSKSFSKNIEVMLQSKELGIQPLLTFSRSSNQHINESPINQNRLLKPARNFLQPRNSLDTLITYGPIRSWSSFYAGGANPIKRADIGHATYYRPQKYDFKEIKRLAVTIHDFIPEHLNWNGIRNPHIGKSQLIRKADLVVCISETTRDLLYERYGLIHENVVVVPHGTDIVSRNYEKGEVFPILYIGHRKGYKNFDLLVSALTNLRNVRPFKLWIAGPPLDDLEISSLNLKLGGNWSLFENPSDEEIKNLYSKAAVHCVTSRMEGFGMTAIESVGAGCPVIASDIPIFRETLRGNGILVDPENSEELENALSLLMTDQTHYDSIENNLINVREQYSWNSVTPKLTEAYRRLI